MTAHLNTPQGLILVKGPGLLLFGDEYVVSFIGQRINARVRLASLLAHKHIGPFTLEIRS